MVVGMVMIVLVAVLMGMFMIVLVAVPVRMLMTMFMRMAMSVTVMAMPGFRLVGLAPLRGSSVLYEWHTGLASFTGTGIVPWDCM